MKIATRVLAFGRLAALLLASSWAFAGCGGDSAPNQTASEEAKQAQQTEKDAWEKSKTDPAAKAPAH